LNVYADAVVSMQSTSIRIRKKTRDHLQRLKQYPRESFDDVISRLIDASADDEPLSEETLAAIEQSLKEYREGFYYTHEEILADLGVAEEPNKAETSKKSGNSEKDLR
jgi:predicted transcriptional regulator